mmetsp:Transcript_38845/g.54700  ORF Transcript_38845/g.54700 Transcript_38845/m.54700 type:complete len:96 (-) Transcript_38845:260-547(-)
MDNMNSKESLEQIKVELLQQLQNLQGAPSVQMQQAPPLFEISSKDKSNGAGDNDNEGGNNNNNNEDNPDERPKAKTKHGDGDKKVHEAEFYDQVD